ncbi:phenylacetic acid degradation operon negative regulatory protein PaaX [Marinomonas sp. A79]|uniref:Phenylacetic acid degradation operon negative regulatory protein PaaX n=1 Tax=Marinomonas vulgaris TaxID=2823372 RepID=A0ABS5HCX9_9GAMM|nr:phenylacetic acid degradation operon negative regulatory protein PaaX [Marinomonas vulgaris]MBR7889513.1 phenylacetic acid degradation operon negative regulatory protein PaaX [Marinomonas vulgaris]
MHELHTLDALIQRFQQQKPIRASSLIITLYGDTIEPHGGTVWLGSLINALEPIGINERLMRTSIFRLSQDGWIDSDKVGRRSYYSLTHQGHRKFEQAFQRIYNPNRPPWDNTWTLILVHQLSPEEKKTLSDELRWQGFAVVSTHLIASPCADKFALKDVLRLHQLEDKVVVLDASSSSQFSNQPLPALVEDCWGLEALAAQYQAFIALFHPVWQEVGEKERLDPKSCFLTRTLLIHEYRKLQLRDPQLPDELLPLDWEGRAARQLCRNIYRKITAAAETWIEHNMESAVGPLPNSNEAFSQRFGGLL